LVTTARLGFEGAVIVVSDYYYNHKTRTIKKREPKRKRENVDTSHETRERSIKWKAGPYLKDNTIQEASTLSAFVGVNIMSVHKVEKYHDTTKARVNE